MRHWHKCCNKLVGLYVFFHYIKRHIYRKTGTKRFGFYLKKFVKGGKWKIFLDNHIYKLDYYLFCQLMKKETL